MSPSIPPPCRPASMRSSPCRNTPPPRIWNPAAPAAQTEPPNPEVDWTRVVDTRPEDVRSYGLRGPAQTDLGDADHIHAECNRTSRRQQSANDPQRPPFPSTE